MFIGNSHANGGIPSEIAETGTKIEIEGNEYYICNEAYNSPNHFDFKKKTNKEILDFIYTEFACKLNQDIMHSGDFIVCKVVVADNRKKDRKGTIKQILNEMQGEKNCKVESSSNYLKQGGELIKRADGSYSKRGLWDNIRANKGSGRKPTKEMLKQEDIIREKYHLGGDMSKHLAPNGKPSNLNHEQWHLVRTDAFKQWFGDWEKLVNAKMKDSGMDEVTLANLSKDVSKVVDENGEPLVVFHGTDKEFSVYDLNKIGEGSDLLGKGIYLTQNKEVANFYANLVSKKRYIKGYEQGVFGTESPLYEKDADIKAEKHKLIYDFFVNAKNIVNINEININNDIKEILIESISFMFGDQAENIINSRIDFVDKNYNKIKNYRGKIIYLIEQFPDAKKGVLEYIKNKYDCIVFEPTNEFEEGITDYKNYVVFNSNQIKLADGTNTTFDGGNDDIRFDEGGEVSKNVDAKLKELGFEFNKSSYRYGKTINEQDYITAFYDKRNQLYKIRGTHKFITPLGENSVGIQFDFNDEKEFYNKIQEYLSKSINNSDIRFDDGGEVDNFNWESLYNTSDEQKESLLSEEQEKEERYQKSSFSKNWASTRSIAIDKLVKQYLDAKRTYDDWASREYKQNKSQVFIGGDDIFGQAKSIGSINEGKRQRVLKGSKMLMDESIADLKEIGLSDLEIDNLINNKDKQPDTLFNNGGMINFVDSNDYEKGTLFNQ